MLKVKSSSQISDTATVQYENAVLEAYGIVPMKDCFPSPCSRSLCFKRGKSSLQINHFGLSRRRETANHESEEEDSMNAKETQIPLTKEQEQPLHSCATEKSAKNDVFKAYGII